jgi:hypothetical protein
VAQNAGVPLTEQNSYADSGRAGQFYNSVGCLGFSWSYGTVTVFRQNALTLDGVFAYDSTAFKAGDKLFNVVWVGVKYAVTTNLDVTGANYFNYQPTYGAVVTARLPRRRRHATERSTRFLSSPVGSLRRGLTPTPGLCFRRLAAA